MRNKPTEKLLEKLNGLKDLSQLKSYIDSNSTFTQSIVLSEYILEVCSSKGFKKNDIIKNANIYRTYGYEILSGKKLPSRDKLLQICIGNKFTLVESNRCLTIGKLGILYAKDPKDSIIIFALNNKLNLMDTNIILDEHDLSILD